MKRLIPTIILTLSCLLLGACAVVSTPTLPTSTLAPPQPPLPIPTLIEPTAAPLIQPAAARPITLPPGFEMLVENWPAILLPAQFPASEGLPAIVPFILSQESGGIDISLDFGPECQGAGACHYGSLGVRRVTGAQPESTATFPFDPTKAKPVTLANGTTGFYLQGACGASCDDSRMFWITQGYQYVIGIKGANEQAVTELANAAIQNSLVP